MIYEYAIIAGVFTALTVATRSPFVVLPIMAAFLLWKGW